MNPNKILHVDIPLKFGRERAIEFNFAQRERNWACLRNGTNEKSARGETDRSAAGGMDEDDKAQLYERRKQMELETKMLKDVRSRLEVHRIALRLIVAESLKDYHEQFQMILSKPQMIVNSIGPDLMELNRENLKL